MSCNKDIYEKEEEACRETFLNDAEKSGIPFYFYKGINEEHPKQFIDEENHVMYLPVNDGLGGTSKKTVLALNEALKIDGWDYIVKTNVSTWLDISKIQKAVDKWAGNKDRNIYGARFLANDASRRVPFPRGHFVILSRELVSGIVQWSPKLIVAEGFPRTDDTLICLSLLYHIQKALGETYQEKLMEVPSVISWQENIQDSPDWSDALSVRCKDEKTPENTPDNMRKVSRLKRSKKQDRSYYRPMHLLETKYGLMTYQMYEQVTSMIKKIKEAQQQVINKPTQTEITPDEAEQKKKFIELREKLKTISMNDEKNQDD